MSKERERERESEEIVEAFQEVPPFCAVRNTCN